MNREQFCSALREGLSGLPPASVDDLVGDYEAHFEEGVSNGRTEEELAAALGEPRRLARELRLEAGLQRWEERRTPTNAIAAVLALVGLGAIDVIILLPILASIAGILMGLVFGCIGVFIAGSATVVIGPFVGPPGGAIAAILFGIGLISGSVAAAAILAIVTIGLVNGLVWFARLHYRALNLVNEG